MSDAPDERRPDRAEPLEEYADVDPDTVVEDAVELFTADDESEPVADADAPAPPG